MLAVEMILHCRSGIPLGFCLIWTGVLVLDVSIPFLLRYYDSCDPVACCTRIQDSWDPQITSVTICLGAIMISHPSIASMRVWVYVLSFGWLRSW